MAIVHIIMLMCTGLVESCKRVACKREKTEQAFEERYVQDKNTRISVLESYYATMYSNPISNLINNIFAQLAVHVLIEFLLEIFPFLHTTESFSKDMIGTRN